MRVLKVMFVFVCIVFICQNVFALFCPQCGVKNSDRAKFCTHCGAEITDGKSKTMLNASSIKGNVYVTLGSGQSNIQRGLQIFLIKTNRNVFSGVQKIKEIEDALLNYNTTALTKVQNQSYNDYYEALGYLSAGTALIKRHSNEIHKYFNSIASESAHTDVNGAYEFCNIAEGDHYIFAQYKSSFEDGYWLAKISVEKNESKTLDLSNFNLINITQQLRHSILDQCKEHLFKLIEIQSGRMDMLLAKKTTLEMEISSSKGTGPILGGLEYPSAKDK